MEDLNHKLPFLNDYFPGHMGLPEENSTEHNAGSKPKGTVSSVIKKGKEKVITKKAGNSLYFVSSENIQEPLRKIQTFSSRILEKEMPNLSESGKECFNRMINATMRMQTVIENLSTYSGLEGIKKEFKKVSLKILLNEAIQELKKTVDEKQAIIECNDLSEALVIPSQFRQLFMQILDNSLKFSSPERRLRIFIGMKEINGVQLKPVLKALKSTSSKRYFQISISDNGIGIDNKHSKKIFEMFERLNPEEKYPGTGIGLALCKKIARNHKGFITASGVINQGTRIDIYFPVS